MIHKAGDKMYVDFTGEKLYTVDKETGEIIAVEVFVAILGASQLTYVEATVSQKKEDFIMACENALHYYQGVPSIIFSNNYNHLHHLLFYNKFDLQAIHPSLFYHSFPLTLF